MIGNQSQDDAPAAIMATTGRVTTMADNTLRLIVEVAPADAKRAFELFGAQGTSIALAVLTNSAAIEAGRSDMMAGTIDGKGPHGKSWVSFYKAGTFFAPELHRVLGIEQAAKEAYIGGGQTELVKESIYKRFTVSSLTDISPTAFRKWCVSAGIEHILPKDF